MRIDSATASERLAHTRHYLAEKKDGAQIDLDVVTHLISLFQASKQGKEERLVIIEVEVEDAQVQLLRSLAFFTCRLFSPVIGKCRASQLQACS